jgi:hypothetical protein
VATLRQTVRKDTVSISFLMAPYVAADFPVVTLTSRLVHVILDLAARPRVGKWYLTSSEWQQQQQQQQQQQ